MSAGCAYAAISWRLQPITAAFAVKGARVDAQDLRGLFQRRRRAEDAANVLGLEIVERHAGADFEAGPKQAAELHRQVREPHLRRRRQDHAALDGVAQLAEVAGPGI